MAIDNNKLTPVLVGIHLVALPLYPRMPAIILVVMALFTFWTMLIILGRVPQLKKIVLILLAATVVIVLMVSYGRVFGQGPGTSMLLMLSFLKLFEMKSKRDIVIVIFMSYFLIASNFFHTQNPWIVVYTFAVVIYLTSLLIIFSDRRGTLDFKTRLRASAKMILQATPLMLILFILFPRVPGPFWALPSDAQVARTGISEEMAPGSINGLISSGAVAFRVKFEDQSPPHESLYWRGLVLSKYDGQKWTRDDAPSYTRPEISVHKKRKAIESYAVTLEPHGQRWLYSLETMTAYDHSYRVSRELQVFSNEVINDVVIYKMSSDLDVINHGLYPPERDKNLVLPIGFNQKTKNLARDLKTKAKGDEQKFVALVLGYFRNNEFFYTLSPPLLGRDAMDDFLFDSRRGFCEHYASAFVHLMRAGGMPARIIVGYQGGAINPVDDYMIVRQSDAHAWTEVWFSDQGWVRVDPTAAVSPGRVERGIQSAGVELARLPSILISNNLLFLKTRYLWDSFHNTWNQWVVGFNQKKQKELFSRLGIEDINASTLVMWLVIAMSACGGLVALWVFRRSADDKKDKVHYYYDVFCRKLAKAGMGRKAYEGPREYSVRVSGLSPAIKDKTEMIINYYQNLRYGAERKEGDEKQFVRCVKQFKVKNNR